MVNFNFFLKNNKKFIYIYFVLTFLLCLYILPDFGVTVDDETYYVNGLHTYNYIKLFLLNTFSNSNYDLIESRSYMAEWPILFELILVFLSKLLNISDTRDLYLLAHKLNIIFFFVALILFFKIINSRFNNTVLAIISTLFILLSPRIFAESFYNTRDIFFFSLFIYFIYFLYKFIDYKSYLNIILMSLFSSFLINAKILGLIPVIFFILFYFFVEQRKHNHIKQKINFIILYLIFIILFSYILWPYLWNDPINNLYYAFTNILKSHESLTVINYYFGEHVSSKLVAWHYRPVWLLTTTPFFIIILFTVGAIIMLSRMWSYVSKVFESQVFLTKEEFLDYFLFILFFLTFFITIKLNGSKFGGWRHLYFLYPIVVYFTIFTIHKIYLISNFKVIKILQFIILLNVVYLLIWNVKNHPNQYVFFNSLIKNYALEKFDLDMWGISHKQSLDKILEIDTAKNITVYAKGYTTIRDAYLFLNESEKKRIKITDFEDANYVIDIKMNRVRKNMVINSIDFDKFFDISVDEMPITTVYKRKNIIN